MDCHCGKLAQASSPFSMAHHGVLGGALFLARMVAEFHENRVPKMFSLIVFRIPALGGDHPGQRHCNNGAPMHPIGGPWHGLCGQLWPWTTHGVLSAACRLLLSSDAMANSTARFRESSTASVSGSAHLNGRHGAETPYFLAMWPLFGILTWIVPCLVFQKGHWHMHLLPEAGNSYSTLLSSESDSSPGSPFESGSFPG